jgi:hypothetical protein
VNSEDSAVFQADVQNYEGDKFYFLNDLFLGFHFSLLTRKGALRWSECRSKPEYFNVLQQGGGGGICNQLSADAIWCGLVYPVRDG